MASIVVTVAPPQVPDTPSDFYATVQDVRNASSTSATNNEIERALEFATALVDAVAGQNFRKIIKQTVYDVRTDTVVLDVWPGEVTGVKVGETLMSSAAYEITPWGLRFLRPPRGFLYHPSQPLTVEPLRSWWHGGWGRGATVTIDGTFRGTVPTLIREATTLLAIDRLPVTTGTESATSGIPELPSDVASFSVEGLSVAFRDTSPDAGSATLKSSGNATADRLIRLAVGARIGVA